MKEKIEFDWSKKLEITDIKDQDVVIETFPADKLERSKYANFLTQYLISSSYDESKSADLNYVLNLNSEWGSGKSYFLRRWADDLKSDHPVVYIDAWKQDYSEDPLMTVISSLISQLREQADIDENDIMIKAPKKLIGLLKAAAPSLVRGLSKRYIGIDPVKIMESDEEETIGDVKDENGNPIDMGLAASKIVEQLINEHDSKAVAIKHLKLKVNKWIELVVQEKSLSKPAFVFIDELDRCRPSYAVEMLETIKHIFDIPGVVFVVATDTEQLQHAVKAIYGVGFDARVYLSRFFNSRFSLKAPNLENLLEVHCDIQKLSKEYFDKLNILVWPVNDDYSLTLDNITAVLNAFKLSPRSAIQITERIIATLSNLNPNAKIDLIMLTTLLCIREKEESLYEEIITKKFNRKEGDNSINLSDYLINYFTIKQIIIQIDINIEDYSNSLSRGALSHFKSGKYFVDYSFYLSVLFAELFGEEPSIYDVFGQEVGSSLTPLEKIAKDFIKLPYQQRACFRGKSANLWLKYSNVDNNLNEVDIGFYQDLVELASSIDWLSEEEKNNK